MSNRLLYIILSIYTLFLVFERNEAQAQKTVKTVTGVYTYTTVTDDPFQTRIYTLKNGLTVFISVNSEAPRVQTYIAVKAGSKMDPATATGLAHYLEHMVFKGTSKIGAKDFSKEKPLLDEIERIYEVYNKTKDYALRKKLYQRIDSLSGIAAQYAIANEYDKLVSTMGAKGTNAYTFVEQTVYVNDIPSNEIERWLEVEAERFQELAPRLFHTELEAVYEEKNRSLDNDYSQVFEKCFAALFPNHPYGKQTTIGTVEHLQNPSITAIKHYFYTYYVPNNVAICLSGDLDPDRTIQLIDKYFGNWKPKPVPPFSFMPEHPIQIPYTLTVTGPSPEGLVFCYRFPGAANPDAMTMELFSKILSNGSAGLMDLNLVQKQKVLSASAFPFRMKDYSMLILFATAKKGQTVEEVKQLVLSQIDSIKAGKFEDALLQAILNNEKVADMKEAESNKSRADQFVDAFVKDIPWNEYLAQKDYLNTVTKQDIVRFANTYLGENYVMVHKTVGKDTTIKKVVKPAITPVTVNRDAKSDFYEQIVSKLPKPIEPSFVDYTTAFSQNKLSAGHPFWYLKNKTNALFELYYRWDMGSNQNKKLDLAVSYLTYLGTKTRTAEELKKELYTLGCTFSITCTEEKTTVTLSGLEENREKAMQLVDDLLYHAVPDQAILSALVEDILKEREDAKLQKGIILNQALVSYAKFGTNSPFKDILSEKELKSLRAEQLVQTIKYLGSYAHHVWYYGPEVESEVQKSIEKIHKMTPNPKKPLPKKIYKETTFTKNQIYFVHYDMVQAELVFLSKGVKYKPEMLPKVQLYNEYFGGGMGSIVFQEIRESKALAYSTRSYYSMPSNLDYSGYSVSYIGTQADKLPEAMQAMMDLLDKMPQSPELLQIAKESLLGQIRTQRIQKSMLFTQFEKNKELGLDRDIRKDVYEKLPNLTFDDIESIQRDYIREKPYTLLVIGSRDRVNLETLKKYGDVKELTLQDIFGY